MRILRDNLAYDGYAVEVAIDGKAALEKAREFAPDLVILDIMLPGMNGYDVCVGLRERTQRPTSILILTAKSQKSEKIRGLDLGADDYMTKPFDLDELLARVRAILRRVRPTAEILVMGALRIDFVSQTVSRGQAPIYLTHREFEIVRYLSERPGIVVHRDELLRELWGYHQAPFTRSVDLAIARLRKKLEEDPQHPRLIHTVRGDGYILTPAGGRSTGRQPKSMTRIRIRVPLRHGQEAE